MELSKGQVCPKCMVDSQRSSQWVSNAGPIYHTFSTDALCRECAMSMKSNISRALITPRP